MEQRKDICVAERDIEIFSLEHMYPDDEQDDKNPLIVYKAIADSDTVYLHQAMKESDKDNFIQANIQSSDNVEINQA